MLIGESTPEETQQALIKEINAILADDAARYPVG